ncbi:hypothetical protein [Butyrivibrio sp. JL13D10]|uniref:hypothetical protein n=1 Tax=Butyrivibrio sp. JL13D10 TaxID=3236815 RepID=UPI0038B64FA1
MYDELDEARKEYHDEVVGYDPYAKGLNKYVKSVKVVDRYDDREYSNMFFYKNHDKVTIAMTDGFDWLPVKERCAICAEVMDEIRPEMNRYFKKSRFTSCIRIISRGCTCNIVASPWM